MPLMNPEEFRQFRNRIHELHPVTVGYDYDDGYVTGEFEVCATCNKTAPCPTRALVDTVEGPPVE